MEHLTWRTSSYRSDVGNCVEVANLGDGGRPVRDATEPAGPALAVAPVGRAAFTAGVRNGEFDWTRRTSTD